MTNSVERVGVAGHARLAAQVRAEMGGVEKIERLHARGRVTVRERIDALVDPESFSEIGTFAFSKRADDRADTPGDGKVGGWTELDGRPVIVYGDYAVSPGPERRGGPPTLSAAANANSSAN